MDDFDPRARGPGSSRDDTPRRLGRTAKLPHGRVDPASRTPVFEQIQNLVRSAIATDFYVSGDRLPSVVALSRQLKVNLNTVAKAYRELGRAGVLVAVPGSGCYVHRDAPEMCRGGLRKDVRDRLRDVLDEARAAGLPQDEIASMISESLSGDSSPFSGAQTVDPDA